MKKLRIILGMVIPDIAGILIISIPMVIFLSLTNFFRGPVSGFPSFLVALILLLSLSLFIFPFRLFLLIAQKLKMEFDKYIIFSLAIIGGLIGGSLFYFLILYHFSLTWPDFLDYALLGAIQSLIVHIIYIYIPENWKIQPAE